jgi:hypothetical protein
VHGVEGDKSDKYLLHNSLENKIDKKCIISKYYRKGIPRNILIFIIHNTGLLNKARK